MTRWALYLSIASPLCGGRVRLQDGAVGCLRCPLGVALRPVLRCEVHRTPHACAFRFHICHEGC
ncbi:unnamed protein product [Tuber aestivum]|uniref:Uncharacterized protein n=1 Tax=Tuber aestivum TaxID=59557 RepID=A0A292PYT5_9PEZI|nr:unnamed protein product [Tuber aestivum]